MTMTQTLAASAAVVPAEQARIVNAFGVEIAFMLTEEQTGGAMTVGLNTVPPGGGPPPHVHTSEDEMFIIVEGRYALMADGVWSEAGPGAVAYLPRGIPHTFRNVGETPAKHWVVSTPSGFERFFEGASALFSAPGGPDMPGIVTHAAEHGITFL
jgi:quercetin dioxygenase-like cupin family protein